jgi:hypothetical protein
VKSKYGSKDPAVIKARGKWGSALRECDEEMAVQAARELVQALRIHRIRKDLAALAASGVIEDDTEATS